MGRALIYIYIDPETGRTGTADSREEIPADAAVETCDFCGNDQWVYTNDTQSDPVEYRCAAESCGDGVVGLE